MVHHVCVLGNSHLASARRAWPMVKDRYPQLQITFFGGPGKTIGDVKLVEGALIPDNERSIKLIEKVSGRRDIVISEYSAFCVVGSGLRPAAAAELGNEYSTQPDRGRRLISPAMFASLLSSELDRSIAMRLARLIRSQSTAPLFLIGQPYPIAAILDEGEDPEIGALARRWQDALLEAPVLNRIYTKAMEGLAKSVDGTFVPQPPSTIQQSILTASSYRLDRESEHKDFAHTNEAYGELVIESLNALLSEPETGKGTGR